MQQSVNKLTCRILRLLSVMVMAICVGGMLLVSGTEVRADGANLVAAQTKYNVPGDRVTTVSNVNELTEALTKAGSSATVSSKAIVYLRAGSYQPGKTVIVPENVILVAESGTQITPSGTFPILIKVYGAIYGGLYDSAYKNQTTIKFLTAYKNQNGQIDKATVTRSAYYGIVGQGSKDAVVNGCVVSKCKASGISIIQHSHMGTIANTTVRDNGTAGINLSFSDVDVILNCTINNNGNKAVSTNSDSKTGCHIKTIRGCTIKNNKDNGVHIKPNCTLDSFVNNTLINNNDGLTAAAVTKEGTKGKSVIKNVSGNTFKGSKDTQIEALGKGASITIKNNNKVLNGKSYGVLSMRSGKIVIKGSKNQFNGNFKGLGAQSSGTIQVTGKNNVISKNKNRGVHAIDKGTITITGAGNKISDNKAGAVYCASKAKITLKKVKVSGKVDATNDAKVIKK